MPELIDRQSALSVCKEYGWIDDEDFIEGYNTAIKYISEAIKELPTIKPEVRHGNGCSYCKGRAYSKKPLTVITRTMKRVEVVFEYCPACGKKMNRGADNG